ncbi:hypothetical protein B0T24DRAFT_237089 [Lasiosphaeria ovina]|uniref:Ankyrin n=1 Tax=Lasiosphaeria ovina TaxID=92902 RepID=A0AAE0NAX4_9PEZI|nr:hypothetical protein B0T24DRAFT_237089 [Lasiosphaeria ovina]
MDPLSIAASVIAVAGAVATATKILAPILKLRSAPIQFVQLFDEVSDVQAVLVFTLDAVAEFEAQGNSPKNEILRLLGQTKATLEEISRIMTTKILVAPSKAPTDPVQISKTGWLRYGKKVRALLKQLHETRQNIDSLVSAHTVKTMSAFRLDLQDIAVLSREQSTKFRDFESTALQRLEMMHSRLEPVDSLLQALHSTMQHAAAQSSSNLVVQSETTVTDQEDGNVLTMKTVSCGREAFAEVALHKPPPAEPGISQSEKMPEPGSDLPFDNTSRRSSTETLVAPESELEDSVGTDEKKSSEDDPDTTPDFLVKASVYRPGVCRSRCACRCHTARRVKTPAWAAAAVGNMFLGYSVSPLVRFRACNDLTCQQNSQRGIRIAYYFPRWFLDRMVEVICNWGPIDGHRVSIRTPRLVAPDADVFAFASKGNVEGLRMLFSRGEASPFDVSAVNGRSALNLATMEQEPRTCQFLIQAGANPHEKDQIDRSPVDQIWNMMVRERTSERFNSLVKVFNLDIEDGYDYLLTRKYTPLHQIIMGLKTHPAHDTSSLLALQLSLSAEDIDAQDTQGRTPLHWAVIKGNAKLVNLLLGAGASVEIRDYKKQPPIHLCATGEWAGADCLGPLLYVAAQREWEERHKLRLGRRGSGSLLPQSQYSSTVWSSKLVNDNADYQGRTPALLAGYNDGDDKLTLLIQHGADIELADMQGRTPLLFAISREARRCIALLLDHGARTDVADNHGSTILHYAARYGTAEILQVLAGRVWGVDVSAHDKDGNTAHEIFTHHRSRAPNVHEISAFNRLLVNAARRKVSPRSSSTRWALAEDCENNSDTDPYFTAASSLEASLRGSVENSIDDLRREDGNFTTSPSVLSGAKSWIYSTLWMGKSESTATVTQLARDAASAANPVGKLSV